MGNQAKRERNAARPTTAPTLADVARVAGVSHQTVSRVLNDHPSVLPATRKRVQAAIEQLSYRRNVAARALVTRRSQTLGVISFGAPLYGPMSTVYSIERAAREAGYFVAIATADALTSTTLREAVSQLTDQGVEGIVVIAPVREAIEALQSVRGTLPIVAVEGGVAPGFPVVSVDQELGARTATRHLLDQGVDTVWHVTGPSDWLEAEARIKGWREELTLSGHTAPDPLPGDWSPAAGYAAGRELAERRDVQAVFVANDQMALGLLRAFHEVRLRVPEDVIVAGFDDIPEAAYFPPPLTTIRQDFATVGRRSIDLLLEQVAGSNSAEVRVLVAPQLIIRQSSARPNAPHVASDSKAV